MRKYLPLVAVAATGVQTLRKAASVPAFEVGLVSLAMHLRGSRHVQALPFTTSQKTPPLSQYQPVLGLAAAALTASQTMPTPAALRDPVSFALIFAQAPLPFLGLLWVCFQPLPLARSSVAILRGTLTSAGSS